jgi:hypothetical protein
MRAASRCGARQNRTRVVRCTNEFCAIAKPDFAAFVAKTTTHEQRRGAGTPLALEF